MTEYKEYLAWDAATRWFHWINALAVVPLPGYFTNPKFRIAQLNEVVRRLARGSKRRWRSEPLQPKYSRCRSMTA